MAAKSSKKSSKKIPAKKVPAKKGPKLGSQKKEKIVPALPISPASDVEVVVVSPNLISPEVMQQIVHFEEMVGKMNTMPDIEVAQTIFEHAFLAADYSRKAKTSSALALVSAWVCGVGLNEMKERLLHGEFSNWRKENYVDHGYSERSSTRYMRLAEAYSDVRELLAWSPGLTKSYIACGILPEPPPTAGSGEKEKISEKEKLSTGLSNVQKHLRLFGDALDGFKKSKGEFSPEEKSELRLMKDAIDLFTQRILELLP